MRYLFLLIVIANALIFGLGQGWFGTPPAEQGREPQRLQQQVKPQSVQVEQGKVQR